MISDGGPEMAGILPCPAPAPAPADPLERCATSMRAVHAARSPPGAPAAGKPSPGPEVPAAVPSSTADVEAATEAEAGARAVGGGKARSGSCGKEQLDGSEGSSSGDFPPGRSVGSQLRREGDQQLRVVMALTKAS